MHALDDRYAVISHPDQRLLARGLRPLEAAAYVETYNRILYLTHRRRAEMVRENAEEETVTATEQPESEQRAAEAE